MLLEKAENFEVKTLTFIESKDNNLLNNSKSSSVSVLGKNERPPAYVRYKVGLSFGLAYVRKYD